MSKEFEVALLRSVYGGVLAGAAAGVAAYAAHPDLKAALLGGAGALIAYLVARGGAEGWVDTSAAAKAKTP